MTRINEYCLATQVKEHWLTADPLNESDYCLDSLSTLNSMLTELAHSDGFDCSGLVCTGSQFQPYNTVDELRSDFITGEVKYRAAKHPLGTDYDRFRALHDIKHHCQANYCFGFPGEIASAADTLELVVHNGDLDTHHIRNPEFLVSLVLSDVAAPNAAYFIDAGWGDYDYTKLVSWPRHLVSKVLELGKHYARKFNGSY